MSDLFGAAAARAQQKRENEKEKDGSITLQNNALVQLMEERRKMRETAEAIEEQWKFEIDRAFWYVQQIANEFGRNVKEITYNGEVAFIARDTEAVRVYLGKIRDMRDLQRAIARLMNCAMGC